MKVSRIVVDERLPKRLAVAYVSFPGSPSENALLRREERPEFRFISEYEDLKVQLKGRLARYEVVDLQIDVPPVL
jgi:hypothetical protein